MGREWTAKSFKSGNSVALRLPSGMKVAPGGEWRIVEDAEGYRLEKIVQPPKRIDLTGIWGSCPGLNVSILGDRSFEPRPSELRKGGRRDDG